MLSTIANYNLAIFAKQMNPISRLKSFIRSVVIKQEFMFPVEALEDEEQNVAEPVLEIDTEYPILRHCQSDLFFMPNLVGPFYHNRITTSELFPSTLDEKIKKCVAFGNLAKVRKLPCPNLMLRWLERVFSDPPLEFVYSQDFIIINMHFSKDVDTAIKSFVLIASNACTDLKKSGYWADFVNPFTGRAYFRGLANRTELNNTRFMGHNIGYKYANGCTVIEETKASAFVGDVFTNAPSEIVDNIWDLENISKKC